VLCGIDEAGRGPVLGPLVVGAAFVEDDAILRELGVKDSKQLSASKRERIYSDILEHCDHVCTAILPAGDIDIRRKSASLNDIEMDMFIEVASRHDFDIIYADCPDVNENRFSSEMSLRLNQCRVVARHRADDTYPVVSAASIVAKVTRDRILDDLRSEFDCMIGSGYPSDSVTMDFIEKWIKDNGSPPPHTRCSWKPVRHMMSIRQNTKLTDW